MFREQGVKRRAVLAAGALPLLGVRPARAAAEPVKIGVLCDMSGPYMDTTGPGLTLGTRMAVEEFGGTVLGRPIEIVAADDQNKPDVGTGIARRWLDVEGVSAIVEGSASSIALGVAEMTRVRSKMLLIAASTSADLTGKACSPTSVMFGMDTFCGPNASIHTAVKGGAGTWYILYVDYAFGLSFKAEATRIIEATGAKVVGTAAFALGTSDMSSQLLQAQASGAKAIALACGGVDWINLVKQAHEFGIGGKNQQLVTFLSGLNEVIATGVPTAAGMQIPTIFYWDADDATRAFTAKFRSRHNGVPPNWQQASAYSATLHYLKAVKAANSLEGPRVAEVMRETKVNDFTLHDVEIRADGRVMRPMYMTQVKQPGQPKGTDDLLEIVKTIPGIDVWRPAAESACPLLRRS